MINDHQIRSVKTIGPGVAPRTAVFDRLAGVPVGEDVRLVIRRAHAAQEAGKRAVHIVPDSSAMARFADLVSFFDSRVRVLRFPGWDCLPYDRVSPSPSCRAERIETLTALMEEQGTGQATLLLTTPAALMQRVMPRAAMAGHVLHLALHRTIDRSAVQSFLTLHGYVRTDTVRQAGEYAVRGGLMDVFPVGAFMPVRMDFFGDTIDSFKSFDPDDQRTTQDADPLRLLPADEFRLDPASIQRFRERYRESFGVVADDPVYSAVTEGRLMQGLDHWLPFFHETMDRLADYWGEGAWVSMDHDVPTIMRERAEQIRDFYTQRASLLAAEHKQKRALKGASYRPVPPESLFVMEGVEACLGAEDRVLVLSSFYGADSGVPDHGARRARDFADVRQSGSGDVLSACRDYLDTLRTTRTVAVVAATAGSAQRLSTMLQAAGMPPLVDCLDGAALAALRPDQTGVIVAPLDHGFVADDLALVSEQDLFGDKLIRKSTIRKKSDHFLKEVTALQPGDLVVHIDHGIGRFDSLQTIDAAGARHDCLCVYYADGDRLFIPVENIDTLTKFGHDEGLVPLDKLGSGHWQSRKARIKRDLMAIAGQLLEVAAARALDRADTCPVDWDTYNPFVARFPYQETDDQLAAIDDVIQDLSSGRPMDRLVCGDVGFGKTEIALRAAQIVASNGFQVAVVCPTTLLARQHYHGFSRRFEGTGIRIGHLSRLVEAQDAHATRDALTDGSCQIVIGTHALLAASIQFANLRLVIVDEEQRFGVKQKEKLKALQKDVHVLTLTATPIPRTLQMALTGVRDMSIIATPPLDRMAVRTSVLPYDRLIVREALMREHHRGGQSFIVVPRIQDLAPLQDDIQALVPDLKLIAAHGQMSPRDLESRMESFYEGRYDILLSTNIVESGLDIPRANTILIHHADRFGLAQLYQLRGRVGRSKLRAYAYMTVDPDVRLSVIAEKRLKVLESLDQLGSGFQLATHDLDLRGAGNLLGDDQSGHIREVGIELYQQMLDDAITAARAGSNTAERQAMTTDHFTPSINMGLSLLIPESYVPDLSVRMVLYRRLSDLKTDLEREGLAAELTDRFGPIPPETQNLMDLTAIKQLCVHLQIDRLDVGPKGMVIGFHNNQPKDPERLLRWITERRGMASIRPDQRVSILITASNDHERLQKVHIILLSMF